MNDITKWYIAVFLLFFVLPARPYSVAPELWHMSDMSMHACLDQLMRGCTVPTNTDRSKLILFRGKPDFRLYGHVTLRYFIHLLYLLSLLAHRERSGWSRPYCRQQDYDDPQLPARQAAISVPCRLLHHLAHHLEPFSHATDSSRGGGGRAEAGGGAGQEQGGGAGGAGGAGGVDFCRGGEWQLVVFIQPLVLNQAVAEGGLVVFFTHAFGMWFL
jgi:uncharacterized membrane protein YgcG